ncbi:MAG: recombination regulator RecX [Zoogloeaceae bacterium]|jgi:regulatory protein|nr:recombination regulator RecX [Zoogloeaceae bacterium]
MLPEEGSLQTAALQTAQPLPVAALRAKALALLARREYSRATLSRRLLPLAESVETVERLLDDLTIRQQLSEARYAETRVDMRGRRYGDSRLAHELHQDGLDDASIAAALAAGEAELPRCQGVWRRKFAALPDTLAERARQQRFLRYRGFSAEVIRQVLRGLIEEDGTEHE